MTDRTQPAPPRQETPPNFDVDMANRNDGRQNLRQSGNLDQSQRGRFDQTQQGRFDQNGSLRQDGRITGTVGQTVDGRATGTVGQNVDGRAAGSVQQDVQGNRLTTGDLSSRNQATAGGASIDDHSQTNKTDKSVVMGSQFLPECTVGLSVGVPGSGAFQIGVPSQECIKARGRAAEANALAQTEIARAHSDAAIGTARANADAAIASAQANAEASVLNNIVQANARQEESMTRMACDFSINRAGTARDSWQQFSDLSSKIGRHPTAKAGSHQLWGEAVTASAQSMEAGQVCVASIREKLGVQTTNFVVPPLEVEAPPKPKPPQKKEEKPCPPEKK